MVPMHGRTAEGTFHEPTHPRSPPRRGAGVHPRISVPLLGGVRGGFMVPMHAQKRMEALHEPESAAGILPADLPENSTAGKMPAARWRRCRFSSRFMTVSSSSSETSPPIEDEDEDE